MTPRGYCAASPSDARERRLYRGGRKRRCRCRLDRDLRGRLRGLWPTDSRLVDVDGFANWGNPGSTADCDDAGFVDGADREEIRDRCAPLRIETDGTFGDMSENTNRFDPEGLNETAESEIRWLSRRTPASRKPSAPRRYSSPAGWRPPGPPISTRIYPDSAGCESDDERTANASGVCRNCIQSAFGTLTVDGPCFEADKENPRKHKCFQWFESVAGGWIRTCDLQVMIWFYIDARDALSAHSVIRSVFRLPSSSFVFLRLPSSSFVFLRLPSSSFVFLRLPSSSFVFLRLPSSSFVFLRLPSSPELPRNALSLPLSKYR